MLLSGGGMYPEFYMDYTKAAHAAVHRVNPKIVPIEIARATQNHHFADLMTTLGGMMIPRARLESAPSVSPEQQAYLRRVNSEHESIFDAISRQDAEAARAAMRTHLANSRERRRRLAESR